MSGEPIDLLVIGGGMGGLAAAVRAAQAGASVVLVEKAPRTGGSAVYAGFIWTAPTLEVMRQINPGGDVSLATRLVEGYPDAIDWVRSLGVEVGRSVSVLGYGRGSQTDMPRLLATCERTVRETRSCEILLGTRTQRLLMQDGRVCGAEVVSASGEHREINAHHTLLATGGFGGDASLRERHLHRLARDLPLRANPHSTGDGLRLGLAAGAAFGKRGAGFYGHLVPYGVAAGDAHELWEVTFYHSAHGVLLNRADERFVDETVGDHLSTLAVGWSRSTRSGSRIAAAPAVRSRRISKSSTTYPRNGVIRGRSSTGHWRTSTPRALKGIPSRPEREMPRRSSIRRTT